MSGQLASPTKTKPRLGFLGLGWIGNHRLQSIAKCECAEITAISDPSETALAHARHSAPNASVARDFEELLQMDLQGLVIASPTALHAEQAVRALERGLSVFCQKPLGRNASETRLVVEAARAADRLLAVDLSYRFVAGMQQIRDWVRAGELGDIFAVEVTFHNAYGPGKPWFYQRSLAGGGCLLDLGIHLVDLALWTLDWSAALMVNSQLRSRGRSLDDGQLVEDYAVAQITLANGAVIDLACSWNLPLGRDAQIEVAFFGSLGGVALKNVRGSFLDFTVERYYNTQTVIHSAGDQSWFGAAAAEWSRRLEAGERFDPECERLVDVATVLDAAYARGKA